ncbi:glycoside hydrolase superfamily [Cyathus striatus]|nr:glycoside hydrolase superfamily [Cyathus striatus]
MDSPHPSGRPISGDSLTVGGYSTPLPEKDSNDSLRQAAALTNTYLTGEPSPTPRSNTPSVQLAPLLTTREKEVPSYYSEGPPALVSEPPPTSKPKRRRPFLLLAIAVGALIAVILIVILPVYFTVIKPKNRDRAVTTTGSGSSSEGSSAGSSSTAGAEAPQPTPTVLTTGGDGSTITTEDGSQFVYSNKLGGFWVSDPEDPFNNNAQPNSWTPPLNQSWTYGKDRIFGVNLGGLFVLEPFITPAFTLMAADSASGGLSQLEDHYNTFIASHFPTEQDIAEIAGAGLNWVRIPIPFWAIDKWPGEPFLANTSWKYILRVLGWCRKYGIRVKIDLHTIPGSQNGFNHSGKDGQINFLDGVMGYANAQRALNYIRILTEFFSQQQYNNLVLIFGIINEAGYTTIGRDNLRSFYLQAYSMMRDITGIGEGKGAYMSFHDGFQSLASWSDFMRGADRVALDTHPYFAFSHSPALEPLATGTGLNAGGVWPARACNSWGGNINNSRSAFGVTIAGEFSNGINDCGLFLNGVGGGSSYGGDCSFWQDSSTWNSTIKAGLNLFTLASMDALQDFFFWTWKIGNSTAGLVESPLWSYQLGLQQGWMPTDPRTSVGTCAALGAGGPQFDGTFQPWQTGGTGAGAVEPTETQQWPWPPAQISHADDPVSQLPSYTPTAPVATLPPPALTPTPTKSIDVGNGWFDSQDTAPAPTTIQGCTYPDPWNAIDADVPPLCN